MQRRERCVWYMQEQCLSVLVWCGAVCVFYDTVRCRLRHYTKLPWREIKTKDTLEWAAGPQKARQRKKASGKSISQIQTSSDGNTHKSKHKLKGGGREKQPELKQGIKGMPKTSVPSTLCKVLARSQPTLTTQELQFYS